jgi:hypothetical protein
MYDDKLQYSPLAYEEQLDLAVDLDNIEEALRIAKAGHSIVEMADDFIPRLRHWVDRLCQ